MNVPQPWLDLLRRLMKAAPAPLCPGAGAILRISIYVAADGLPHGWTEPDVRSIEPRDCDLPPEVAIALDEHDVI